jgi:hypothetical protein
LKREEREGAKEGKSPTAFEMGTADLCTQQNRTGDSLVLKAFPMFFPYSDGHRARVKQLKGWLKGKRRWKKGFPTVREEPTLHGRNRGLRQGQALGPSQ